MDETADEDDEDQNIEILKDELPTAFKNVEESIESLNNINTMLDQAQSTPQNFNQEELRGNLDNLNAAVEENEAMVAEFEGGLVEMDPKSKLENRH